MNKNGQPIIWTNEFQPGKLILTNKKTGFRLDCPLDDSDHSMAKFFKWFPRWDSSGRNYYIVTSIRKPNGKLAHEGLHRIVLGLTNPKLQGDHINHKTYDNRRCNLRIVNCVGNGANHKRNFSGFPLVDFHKKTNKWRARIRINGRMKHLGYYQSRELAISIVRKNGIELYGKNSPYEAIWHERHNNSWQWESY